MSSHCCAKHAAKSAIRKHPVAGVVGMLLTAAVVVGVVSAMPDIVRYVKIKMM